MSGRELDEHERQLLSIIAYNVPTPIQATAAMNTEHSTDWSVQQTVAKITRLVNGGYVKREGTRKMQWYRASSMGWGYLSVDDPS